MEISLIRMTNFIKNRNLKNQKINNILYIAGFGQAAWTSILAIYESGWDVLKNGKDNITFCQKSNQGFPIIFLLTQMERSLKELQF